MAFCTNCGNEIPGGIKFCSNCGAKVRSEQEKSITSNNMGGDTFKTEKQISYSSQPAYQNRRYAQPAFETINNVSVSGIDKYGKFFGTALLILAIADFATDPPIVTIILSAAIIGGAVFCLSKKYKLKGFSIAAIVLAVFCLFAGVLQADKYGMFKIPGNEQLVAGTREERDINNNNVEKQEEISSSQVADNSSKTEFAEQTSGVDPELKAFLDSYEDFVDEYVAFMKKYMADPTNAVSMLSEYSEIMGKYADFAEKVDQYDSKEMSVEDEKYYLEVTTRCTQKMLEIYSN